MGKDGVCKAYSYGRPDIAFGFWLAHIPRGSPNPERMRKMCNDSHLPGCETSPQPSDRLPLIAYLK
jgi:hypothetical protein